MTEEKSLLTATRFRHDPRVIEGKKLLMEAVRAYQQQPAAVGGPEGIAANLSGNLGGL